MLGAPYQAELDNGITMAQEQAAKLVQDLVSQGSKAQVTGPDGQPIQLAETQAIALIAYLQRLGTDLYASPPAASSPAAAPTAATPPAAESAPGQRGCTQPVGSDGD
jgi:cytochrome c oxidase cbb3-type subunit I/II